MTESQGKSATAKRTRAPVILTFRQEVTAAIDAFRKGPNLSRKDAVRVLVRDALTNKGYQLPRPKVGARRPDTPTEDTGD